MTLPTPRQYAGVHSVHTICVPCDHIIELNLPRLVEQGHDDTPLVNLPLRCSQCGQLGHKIGLRSSINNAGQFIPGSFEDRKLADCCLLPGQFSLHNTLLVHRSGANLSTDRRIGLGISYVPTSVRHVKSARVPAHLVRGEDRYGHFDLDPAPAGDFGDAAQEVHASSYRRWRDAYAKETARHQEQYLAAE